MKAVIKIDFTTDQIDELCNLENNHLHPLVRRKALVILLKSSRMKHCEISKILGVCDKNIMKSVPGVGQVTANILLAELPECGKLEGKQIAALTGVAPYTRQSGIYKGRAIIRGGRCLPRRALYIAALTAAFSHTRFKDLYQRLIKAGKPAKVALVAVMRKIVGILNAMLKKQESWKENIEVY